jgi:chromosome segregation ATPase
MDIDKLEEEYSRLINTNIELEHKVSENKKEIERIDKVLHYRNEILKLLKKRKKAIDDTVEQERNKYIKLYTNELKTIMVELEQKLTLNNQYISKVESDIKTIEDLTLP